VTPPYQEEEMRWVTLDEMYCWWPCSKPDYPDRHYMEIPDELAERLANAVDEIYAIQELLRPLEEEHKKKFVRKK